jgi:hypothetical protein
MCVSNEHSDEMLSFWSVRVVVWLYKRGSCWSHMGDMSH